MYFTSLLFFKDIYRNFNIDKFINNINEEKLGIFYNNLINKLDSEVIKKYSVKVEKWILSFWKKRLLYTSSSKEKTELLHLLFKIRVERIDECIEIIKLAKYEQLDDYFIYKIQNKKYDKSYPQKTISIFNAIITERTIENKNFAFDYLKEIIPGLVENNKTNNDLRELLTKLITLNCDWANDLLEEMDIK